MRVRLLQQGENPIRGLPGDWASDMSSAGGVAHSGLRWGSSPRLSLTEVSADYSSAVLPQFGHLLGDGSVVRGCLWTAHHYSGWVGAGRPYQGLGTREREEEEETGCSCQSAKLPSVEKSGSQE